MSNPVRKLQQFTQGVCLRLCDVPKEERQYRCCDKMFCELTKELFPPGVEYKPTGHEIPFMGPNGCIVKPEHRLFCTGFLCPGIKKDYPNIWKEYEKLCSKAGLPPTKVRITNEN